MENKADRMEANAKATRDAGEAKEGAIDRSDLNTDALSEAERLKIVNEK